MSNRYCDEIRTRILELKQMNSNKQIQQVILQEFCITIPMPSIQRMCGKRRSTCLICVECGIEFTAKKFRKYCEKCKPLNINHLKASNRYIEEKVSIDKMLEETCNITRLSKEKVMYLLKNNTHSEIRKHFKIGF